VGRHGLAGLAENRVRWRLKVEVVPWVSFVIPARSFACPLLVPSCSFISFSGRPSSTNFTARAVAEINAFWLSDNKLRIQAACPEARGGARAVPPLIPLSVLLYKAVIILTETSSSGLAGEPHVRCELSLPVI